MSSACNAVCSGFKSLRSECIDNPCLAEGNTCYLMDGSIGFDTTCADWCCQSHAVQIFFLVLLFSGGAFLLIASYYYKRLHQINVVAGATNPDGTPRDPNKKPDKKSKKGGQKAQPKSTEMAAVSY